MSKPWLFLVIGGAIAAAAFVPLAIVAFVFLPILIERMAPASEPHGVTPIYESAPQGVTLIYEVDPKSVPDVGKVDMAQLIGRIDSRLNSGLRPVARVRQLDGCHIEITLYSTNFTASQYVDQLLQRAGTLEFRVLANSRNNKQLIDLALADSSKMQIHDDKGDLLAWWIPVKAGEEQSIAGYPEIARRTRKQDDREIVEILVLKDACDVTGKYLTRADVGSDRRGQPCINFTLNSTGGLLFSRLTEDNLPDKVTDFTYKLGIILDGQLFSAPSIQSVIGGRGEITGSFTVQEVKDLVGVLNAGAMQAHLRLIEKDGHAVDPKPTPP